MQRLTDRQRWQAALLQGALPAADADFGDAAASAPLRDAAQRISETLKTLPELVALVRRLGRAERATQPLALPPRTSGSAE